jgi:hypothetical protein
MNDKNSFLEELATLCEKYKATFSYSTNDNGIHICLDGKEVFSGFIDDFYASDLIRLAKE